LIALRKHNQAISAMAATSRRKGARVELEVAHLLRDVKIWDLKGNLVTSLTGHEKYLRSAYFSPSGDQVITASGDGTARVWPNADRIHDWIRAADIYHLTDDDRKKLRMTDEE
jgi:WD40 repeat protein